MKLVSIRSTVQFVIDLSQESKMPLPVVARIVAHVNSVSVDDYVALDVAEIGAIEGVGIVNARTFRSAMSSDK
ncbi:hypothetical protein ER16_Large9 [Pseudomonas phage ER16]|nr:hypothetical protein ER16_Large9 [Pseudomonas phage ER16]